MDLNYGVLIQFNSIVLTTRSSQMHPSQPLWRKMCQKNVKNVITYRWDAKKKNRNTPPPLVVDISLYEEAQSKRYVLI